MKSYVISVVCLGTIISAFAIMKARSKTQFHLVRSKKLKAADDKIKECRLLLTQYCQTISKEKKLAILNAMAYEIVEKITIAKEWTCLEVVCVYSERALDVHEQVNCLTEIMIKEAIEAAIQKDEQFKRDGKSTGILHGVPISLKDTVNYEGFGMKSWLIDRLDNRNE